MRDDHSNGSWAHFSIILIFSTSTLIHPRHHSVVLPCCPRPESQRASRSSLFLSKLTSEAGVPAESSSQKILETSTKEANEVRSTEQTAGREGGAVRRSSGGRAKERKLLEHEKNRGHYQRLCHAKGVLRSCNFFLVHR